MRLPGAEAPPGGVRIAFPEPTSTRPPSRSRYRCRRLAVFPCASRAESLWCLGSPTLNAPSACSFQNLDMEVAKNLWLLAILGVGIAVVGVGALGMTQSPSAAEARAPREGP